MRYLGLLLCAGCMLPSMNKEGLQLVVNDLAVAQRGLSGVAEGLNKIVVEINQQERPLLLEPLMAETIKSLTIADTAINEAGQTATTLQSGIGTPPPNKNLNFTPEQKEMWRARYIALAKLFEKLKTWAKSKIPGTSLTVRHPKPWSGTDIAALLTALAAGAGALGIGGKKANEWRKGANDAEGLATKLKEKMNGDGEFTQTMQNHPTTVRRHHARNINEI